MKDDGVCEFIIRDPAELLPRTVKLTKRQKKKNVEILPPLYLGSIGNGVFDTYAGDKLV